MQEHCAVEVDQPQCLSNGKHGDSLVSNSSNNVRSLQIVGKIQGCGRTPD